MIRIASCLALLFCGAACQVWAAPGHGAYPQMSAGPALYAVNMRAGSYSFVELLRTSIEAESALAGPRAAGEVADENEPPSLPSALPVQAAALDTAGVPAVITAQAEAAGATPQPGRWLMLISGLAIVGFIARRRSDVLHP